MFKKFKTPLLFVVLVCGLTAATQQTNAYIQQVLILCYINIVLAASLNVINGFTGQFSLGHAGFMAVGAYFSAWLSTQITIFSSVTPFYFLNFVLYAIAAGVLAGLVGLLVGLPSLRLKGDYLAIVTLGFGEIIRVIFLNMDVVGGARGFYGIPFVPEPFLNTGHVVFWMVLTLFVLHRILTSNMGRTFLAIREDEIAAESLGLNTTSVKVRSFVLSSFFGGIAGSLFAHYAGNLNPQIFQFVKSVDVVIMVVLGGMGSLTGSVLGAIIVTLLPEVLRPVKDIIGFDIRMIIYALVLIGFMIARPRGLLGKYASR